MRFHQEIRNRLVCSKPGGTEAHRSNIIAFFRVTFQAAKVAPVPVKTSSLYGHIYHRWQWGHGPLLHLSSRSEGWSTLVLPLRQVLRFLFWQSGIRWRDAQVSHPDPRASFKAIVYLHPQPQLNCNVTLVSFCISHLILPHSLEATSMEWDPALNKQTCPCVVPLICVQVSPRAHFLFATTWQQ